MQQKSALKYLILEKKIAAMKDEIDVKDAQLHAVVEQGPSSAARKGNFVQHCCVTWHLVLYNVIIPCKINTKA